MSATTITTAQDAIDAVKRIVHVDVFAATDDLLYRLKHVITAATNAVDALEAIDVHHRLVGTDESSILALHSAVHSLHVLVQESKPISFATGRIEASVRLLGAIK